MVAPADLTPKNGNTSLSNQGDVGEDWGPFGRPLFNDPSSRALSRVGVIDVGSNSVRMVVFDGAARSPAYFYNEKIMCALGAGLAETGKLNPEGRKRALSAMRRFQKLADGMNASTLTAVATAAVREASDGPDFVAEVLAETGITVHVIDGEEEARLSAQGVLLGWPGAYGLICDIGGSSLELAEINDGKVGKRVTSSLGPLKLRDVKGGKKGRKAHIAAVMEDLAQEMGPQPNRLFLVGGSWRAIAKIDMVRRGYPLHVLHEYRMNAKSVRDTIAYIEERSIDELRRSCGISEARIILVPITCEVLKRLIRTFKPHDIAVSSYGIREGMLYEQMSDELRERDPLIEAARFAEAKDARLPGFGKTLYEFVSPLFKSAKWERKRLIKAACLLHDVSWRAHPDYRAELCFDNVTRANLGGLRHSERVFLGLALMNRYKNSSTDSRFPGIFDLLDEKDLKDAEVLGKAMRLGAMLWPRADQQIGELTLFPKKKELHLKLSPDAEPLFGEVARSRLASLARALEAEVTVKIR
ncbi:Ppx/GppA family phosphatase [Thalassovita mediterranea]|uniref:Guanosine-5'-triphosphate,3'-diphosphate pyrophosphatase n=1 Tax=Thalassovita mediterranea TaxID=340021 RepID=A0A0P1GT54_9RHOB|nr:Ppx/GppA family phosphatase [Thalassovita mediterranea]CUH85884.1 Guanosine-5'-triphosphate,3'-diphosphate pyrophosphatase [Thalassovita mediterranea]SIS32727.1 exopolyphosphatase / guanosine-5'-triphosphate,3'-diphosphate pyrophosphatase [Thalassovita mediterranea]